MNFIVQLIFLTNAYISAPAKDALVAELKIRYPFLNVAVATSKTTNRLEYCERYSRSLGNAIARVRCLAARTRTTPVLYFVSPVVLTNGTRWMTGMALRRGNRCRGGVAYMVAQEFNVRAETRVYHSVVGAAHEIGHLLGAEHVSSRTVMNPAPLHVAESIKYATLPFDDKSRAEMNNFMNRCSRRK